jgi:TatA/E family protein of Tat protein translocase
MGPIGVQEMILIFVLALLLFGPKKLPELGRMLGKGLSEFRRAKNELKSTFETHLRELERETRLEDPGYTNNHALPAASSTSDYSSNYPYSYDDYGQYDGSVSSSTTESSTTVAPAPSAETSPETSHSEANASAPEQHSAPSYSPVPDTVPRSNGTHPVEPAGVTAREDHPA